MEVFFHGGGMSITKRFNLSFCKGVVQIKKRRVQTIALFQLVHKLGEEQERAGRKSDIGRILASEFHELIVENQSHFQGETSHDVLDQWLNEGDAVEVLCVVELLDNL